MKYAWMTLAVAVLVAVGCAPQGQAPAASGQKAETPKSETQKQFEKLYNEYASKVQERMTAGIQGLKPLGVMVESARLWEDTFKDHQDVLKARQLEVLEELETTTIDTENYDDVFSSTRTADEAASEDEEKGIVLKQFLWSPVGTASFATGNWLNRFFPNVQQLRTLIINNAYAPWKKIDGNPDAPVLTQQIGSWVFVTDLGRKGDYYELKKIRWLMPKAQAAAVKQRLTEQIKKAQEEQQKQEGEGGAEGGTGEGTEAPVPPTVPPAPGTPGEPPAETPAG